MLVFVHHYPCRVMILKTRPSRRNTPPAESRQDSCMALSVVVEFSEVFMDTLVIIEPQSYIIDYCICPATTGKWIDLVCELIRCSWKRKFS